MKKDELIKEIIDLSGSHSPYEVFRDFVEMSALAISQAVNYSDKRENQYLAITKKYSIDELMRFSHMLHMLCEALEENLEDVLGDVYMRSGCGNGRLGQFFTPFHLSYLTADVTVPDDISENNKCIINEPSVGGGGMIIGAAKVLKERGLNYQRCMKVIAQDLDYTGVYMAYVQFSLLGIDAEVRQGDSLTDIRIPENRIFRTPKNMGVLF